MTIQFYTDIRDDMLLLRLVVDFVEIRSYRIVMLYTMILGLCVEVSCDFELVNDMPIL